MAEIKIDEIGRVFIPRKIRSQLNIKEGDVLQVSVDGNKVVFEKVVEGVRKYDRN